MKKSRRSPPNFSLKNVGNGRGSSKFHFQRDWKPISDGNSISNAIGSPFPTEIPFPTRLEAHFRRKFHFQRGWKAIVWTQFHFQRDWKPISDGNSISNAVGSLLRGRNGISNVFEGQISQ